MPDWALLAAGMLLPVVGGKGGLAVLGRITHRERVTARLRQAGLTSLDQRWRGYVAADVAACWGLLGDALLRVERAFLRWDLGFPLVYGPVCGTAVLLLAQACGCTGCWGWLLAPVGVCMLADWVENLVHLGQMGRFRGTASSLQESRIRVASMATRVKCAMIGVFILKWLVLLGLAARTVGSGAPPATG